MSVLHDYSATITWTGNRGTGTSHYKAYDRSWDLASPGKPVVHCSNDPLLGGDALLYNPEDMLISALSACHMLWYLHLASDAGIIIESYSDTPTAKGETLKNGASRFVSATLQPVIGLRAGADLELADQLHHQVHQFCFISRSVNFPGRYAAKYSTV